MKEHMWMDLAQMSQRIDKVGPTEIPRRRRLFSTRRISLSTVIRGNRERRTPEVCCSTRLPRVSCGEQIHCDPNGWTCGRLPSNHTLTHDWIWVINIFSVCWRHWWEQVLMSIQKEYPWCGNGQMCGHLLAWGLWVQQHHIWELQRKIDPNW